MDAVVIAVVVVVLSLACSVNRLHILFLRRENLPLRISVLLAESQIVRECCSVVVVAAVAVAVALVAVVAVVGGLGVIASAVAAVVLSLVSSGDCVLLSFLRCENPPPRVLH